MPTTRRVLAALLVLALPPGACAGLVLAVRFVAVPLLDAARPAAPSGIVRIEPQVHRHVSLPNGLLDLTLAGAIESNETAHVVATASDGSSTRFDLSAGERHHVAGATIESVRTWRSLDSRDDALDARIDLDTTDGQRVRLANRYLESASREMLEQAEEAMPWIVPDTGLTSWPYTDWRATSNLPLWGRSGRLAATDDVNQGQVGDCWFMAALEAVALANPGRLQQALHENANGTYTVTFHIARHAVPVTVTDEMPYLGDYVYAKPGSDGAKWAMVFEKALAQLVDGYANAARVQAPPGPSSLLALAKPLYNDDFVLLEGISMVTGSHVRELQPLAFGPAVARLADQGYATVVGTTPGGTARSRTSSRAGFRRAIASWSARWPPTC